MCMARTEHQSTYGDVRGRHALHAQDGDTRGGRPPPRPRETLHIGACHMSQLIFFLFAHFSLPRACMQSVQLDNKGVAGPRWRRLTEQAMPRHRISHALNAYSAYFAACARWMANLACSGAHHTASLIAQTDTRKRVRGMQCHNGLQNNPEHTHHGLCTDYTTMLTRPSRRHYHAHHSSRTTIA